MGDIVKTKERGWPGHYTDWMRCNFRRNTLIYNKAQKIVVSTVGALTRDGGETYDRIGATYWYWSAVFLTMPDSHYKPYTNKYDHIDPDGAVSFDCDEIITMETAKCCLHDIEANEMHEKIVKEIKKRMRAGEDFEKYRNDGMFKKGVK